MSLERLMSLVRLMFLERLMSFERLMSPERRAVTRVARPGNVSSRTSLGRSPKWLSTVPGLPAAQIGPI